ncbi:hypothetical protein [Dyella sp. 2RAB6]|uniref:hypothetical protein n=1 Tax=Dyella sp. 2RAB6 TaxID=3232992 RepID=UPI003F8E9D90
MIHGIFERLGLTPEADAGKPAIKRACAPLLKKHRPGESPAAFQRLHDAHQQALQWRRHGACHQHRLLAAARSATGNARRHALNGLRGFHLSTGVRQA